MTGGAVDTTRIAARPGSAVPPSTGSKPHERTPASRLSRDVAPGNASSMFHDYAELGVTAVEVGDYLAQLEAERSLALRTGVAEIDAYMADLDVEIEICRRLYVASAVTEIATLRAELAGAEVG
jgi:hypothetical protein